MVIFMNFWLFAKINQFKTFKIFNTSNRLKHHSQRESPSPFRVTSFCGDYTFHSLGETVESCLQPRKPVWIWTFFSNPRFQVRNLSNFSWRVKKYLSPEKWLYLAICTSFATLKSFIRTSWIRPSEWCRKLQKILSQQEVRRDFLLSRFGKPTLYHTSTHRT
jgi:hypothetical protein